MRPPIPPMVGDLDGSPTRLHPGLTRVQLESCEAILRQGSSRPNLGTVVESRSPILKALLKRWPLISGTPHSHHKSEVEPSPESSELEDWLRHSIDRIYRTNPENGVNELLAWLAQYGKRMDEVALLADQNEGWLSVAGPMPHPEPGRHGDCVVLHLSRRSEGRAAPLPGLWANGIRKVAETIVMYWPTVTYIVVRSWLVHRLASSLSRRGFTLFASNTTDFTSNSSWGQLLDANGRLDDLRVNMFLRSHEFPWSVWTADLTTRAFLEMGLPSSWKGQQITLITSQVDHRVFRRFKRKLHQKWERVRQHRRLLEGFLASYFGNHDPMFLTSEAFDLLVRLLIAHREINLCDLNQMVAQDKAREELAAAFAMYVRSRASNLESFTI